MLAIDAHFWEWLWLVGKRHRDQRRLVHDELARMYRHLLQRLGVGAVPDSLEEAAAEYLVARKRVERRFAICVPRRLQDEVPDTARSLYRWAVP